MTPPRRSPPSASMTCSAGCGTSTWPAARPDSGRAPRRRATRPAPRRLRRSVMGGTVGIVWFRRDLRLADNPTLRRALDECDEIIPVFVVDDRFWSRAGANRRWFLSGCLADLDEQLGGRLVVRRDDPATASPSSSSATTSLACTGPPMLDPPADAVTPRSTTPSRSRSTQSSPTSPISSPWAASAPRWASRTRSSRPTGGGGVSSTPRPLRRPPRITTATACGRTHSRRRVPEGHRLATGSGRAGWPSRPRSIPGQ